MCVCVCVPSAPPLPPPISGESTPISWQAPRSAVTPPVVENYAQGCDGHGDDGCRRREADDEHGLHTDGVLPACGLGLTHGERQPYL